MNVRFDDEPGLLLNWGFDEEIDFAITSKANGGVGVGVMQHGPVWACGHQQSPAPTYGSLLLNGGTDYVTAGVALGLSTFNFTLECWFMRRDVGVFANSGAGGVNAYILISKGRAEAEGTTADANYFFGIDSATSTLVLDFEEMTGGTGPAGNNHPLGQR